MRSVGVLAGCVAVLVAVFLVVSRSSLPREGGPEAARLEDTGRLRELEAEADALWPPHPEVIPALESWLERARDLTSGLPAHREALSELRGRALPWSDEDRARDLAAPAGAGAGRRTWRFESSQEKRRHEALADLIAGLEGLEAELLSADSAPGRHGWSVPRRLELARELGVGFAAGGEHHASWTATLPAIRAAYPGLDLTPQMGLAPLGPDPESGLWEFAHLSSGAPPARDGEGRLLVTESSGVVLVLIPAGSFWMGAQADDPARPNHDPEASSDEGPVREVELSAYFLSKYEMTRTQWRRLTGQDPRSSKTTPRSPVIPVDRVSHVDCARWLPRAGLTLPTEAQWEHGARAGTGTPYAFGSEATSLQGAANLADGPGDGAPTPVGALRANAFGLHDVHGNLWEWCLDGYDASFYGHGPAADPLAPWESGTSRVLRGGGFNVSARFARSAYRVDQAPTISHDYLGVRPARSIDP